MLYADKEPRERLRFKLGKRAFLLITCHAKAEKASRSGLIVELFDGEFGKLHGWPWPSRKAPSLLSLLETKGANGGPAAANASRYLKCKCDKEVEVSLPSSLKDCMARYATKNGIALPRLASAMVMVYTRQIARPYRNRYERTFNPRPNEAIVDGVFRAGNRIKNKKEARKKIRQGNGRLAEGSPAWAASQLARLGPLPRPNKSYFGFGWPSLGAKLAANDNRPQETISASL